MGHILLMTHEFFFAISSTLHRLSWVRLVQKISALPHIWSHLSTRIKEWINLQRCHVYISQNFKSLHKKYFHNQFGAGFFNWSFLGKCVYHQLKIFQLLQVIRVDAYSIFNPFFNPLLRKRPIKKCFVNKVDVKTNKNLRWSRQTVNNLTTIHHSMLNMHTTVTTLETFCTPSEIWAERWSRNEWCRSWRIPGAEQEG